MKDPCVYIMASKRNGTLYTGVTSDLVQRAWQHRESVVEGFTKKYQCKLLVWYEQHGLMESAILREKQIKAGSRARKLALIETLNPDWRALYEEIVWAVVMGMEGPDCSVTFLDCHVAYATRKDGTLRHREA